jgi:acetylglutamate kinase
VQKNFNLAWRNPSNNKRKIHDKSWGEQSPNLIKCILKHSHSIKHTKIVIRLSSVIIEDSLLLRNFAENIEILSNIGLNFVIVHEYANSLAKYLDLLEINKTKYNSHLGNDKLTDLLEAIISGYINKTIVSKLCSFDIMAVGFSGKDGNLLVAKKSNHITRTNSDFHVSEPLLVNPEILFEIEETKIIPVISPVAYNEKDKTMILDADITSAMISTAISADKLIIMCEDSFLINQVGVLSSVAELDKLFENNIEIIPSDPLIKASRYVLSNSNSSIHFIESNKPDSLLLSIFD